MATITVRALDSNGDPMRGQGTSNFLSDINAVTQIIVTRLKLFQGEWFEDTTDGTPMFQSLLGHPITLQAAALILRNRILGTPYVTSISSFSINFTPASRALSFAATVLTQFGTVTVSNQA